MKTYLITFCLLIASTSFAQRSELGNQMRQYSKELRVLKKAVQFLQAEAAGEDVAGERPELIDMVSTSENMQRVSLSFGNFFPSKFETLGAEAKTAAQVEYLKAVLEHTAVTQTIETQLRAEDLNLDAVMESILESEALRNKFHKLFR